MVMTMKLKYLGWVALSGLFAVSLAGCAAQSGQTAPAGSEQAVVQTEETQGPAAGQAAVDEQADAEADAATAEPGGREPPPSCKSSIPAGSLPTTAWSILP